MGLIPGLAQWFKGSGVAIAAAQIQSQAWEHPYATAMAIKKKKKCRLKSSIWDFLLWCKGLKILLLWLWLMLWHGFDPWPGNFHMPWV